MVSIRTRLYTEFCRFAECLIDRLSDESNTAESSADGEANEPLTSIYLLHSQRGMVYCLRALGALPGGAEAYLLTPDKSK